MDNNKNLKDLTDSANEAIDDVLDIIDIIIEVADGDKMVDPLAKIAKEKLTIASENINSSRELISDF